MILIALMAATFLQAPMPTFEAASVKVSHIKGGTTRRIEPDRLTYLHVTLGEFVEMAYGVQHYQIAGPDWVVNMGSSDRYDIAAKAAAAVSKDELQRMLAPLLAERFHLTIHRETRSLPVYALVVGGKGPKFQAGNGGPTSIRPDGSGANLYENYSMDTLATSLSWYPAVGRPVLNRTGLEGGYNLRMNLLNLPPGATAADAKKAVLENTEPLFTALQEQTGLKLKPEKAPIEMIVVDHADKVPTEN